MQGQINVTIHTPHQLYLCGQLQPFFQHVNCLCMHSRSGAFWTHQTCCTSADQLNGISLLTVMLTRQLRPDGHACLESKSTQLGEETCKFNLFLLRWGKRARDEKQAKERQGQSYTRLERKNKNLTLGSLQRKRKARACEERHRISKNFVLGQKSGHQANKHLAAQRNFKLLTRCRSTVYRRWRFHVGSLDACVSGRFNCK